MFDPYRKWLGIPEDQRPPTHYQLLGIAPDEHDLDVIEAAMLRQSAFVRNFQSGQYAEDATRLLNEIAAARLCLVDRKKRSKYDAELRQRQPGAGAPPRARDSGTISRAPASPPAPPPAFDLNQLVVPEPRRPSATGRRLPATGARATGRRPASSGSAGYLWQVPLLTIVVVILVLIARFIGHSIAVQQAIQRPPSAEQTISEEEKQ
ncbi:MAG TPA: hypothetical protein VF278_05910 [Pirellulales bacterium]